MHILTNTHTHAMRLAVTVLLSAFCVSAHAAFTTAEAEDSVRKPPHDIAISFGPHAYDSIGRTWFNLGLMGGRPSVRGLQLNLMTSFARDDMCGLQLSGLSSVASGLRGVQFSGFSNVSLSPFRGVQLSGVTNISRGVKRGIQFSTLANVSSSYMRGLQMGAYNYADTLNGSQLGILNVCTSHPRGVQIGIVNYSRDTIAHKIGLVNLNPKTRVDVMGFIGNSNKLNLALRFRNRSTYNMIGVGTHYMGLDEKFSGSLFYRIGQYFQLSPRWSVSGDVGFFHIETFQRNSTEKPERLYSLQGRLNLDYQVNDRLSAFVSGGWGHTRYYEHNRKYRNRGIIEVGLALRYDHNRVALRSWQREPERELGDSTRLYAFNDPARQRKRPLIAAVEAFGINVLVNGFDRYVMNEDFAKISWNSVKHNVENGFVWDNDQFSTNLFAHPYHGGLYFNSARSNGLTFWESTPYALGGSLMWELACEIEPPAINDLMATTVGGICIGEITPSITTTTACR